MERKDLLELYKSIGLDSQTLASVLKNELAYMALVYLAIDIIYRNYSRKVFRN